MGVKQAGGDLLGQIAVEIEEDSRGQTWKSLSRRIEKERMWCPEMRALKMRMDSPASVPSSNRKPLTEA